MVGRIKNMKKIDIQLVGWIYKLYEEKKDGWLDGRIENKNI